MTGAATTVGGQITPAAPQPNSACTVGTPNYVKKMEHCGKEVDGMRCRCEKNTWLCSTLDLAPCTTDMAGAAGGSKGDGGDDDDETDATLIVIVAVLGAVVLLIAVLAGVYFRNGCGDGGDSNAQSAYQNPSYVALRRCVCSFKTHRMLPYVVV